MNTGPTILHIDDNEAHRYTVSKLLMRAGYQVLEAENGYVGLNVARKIPSLIVLDVNLPDINGFTVCRQLKQNPETSSIPVLHLSATKIKPRDKTQGLEMGADAYLTEPVDEGEFLATVKALLRVREAEEKSRRLVAELQHSEKERRRYIEELTRSNLELDHFAHVASHDLKEPLRMISLYVDFLRKKLAPELDEETQKYMDFTVEGVTRMAALIDDLLAYSSLRSHTPDYQIVDLNDVIRFTLKDLAETTAQSRATISVGNLPTINCDSLRMGQLFQNLVTNALKFRGERKPVIRVDSERKGDWWILSVSDNGIGIGPNGIDKLFKIFSRLHSRKDFAGTGVGLATCKRIVEQHGGKIWVESTLGEGSTFYISLRAA